MSGHRNISVQRFNCCRFFLDKVLVLLTTAQATNFIPEAKIKQFLRESLAARS